ncbi:MAG TPA: hypothetical protein DCO75_04280 [Fibrobacteres bacterium]|jgi:hypothetical protein|nr:hypothetical protein [Fibrobacterota bacterium]
MNSNKFLITIFVLLFFLINTPISKNVFRDTSSNNNIDSLIDQHYDSIWRNDKSPTKSAMIESAILGKKDSFVDSLFKISSKKEFAYSKLFKFDSSLNRLYANFDIIPTVKTEIFDKKPFYEAILKYFINSTVTIHDYRTTIISDSLICKRFRIGWSEKKGLSDGSITLYFRQMYIAAK